MTGGTAGHTGRVDSCEALVEEKKAVSNAQLQLPV